MGVHTDGKRTGMMRNKAIIAAQLSGKHVRVGEGWAGPKRVMFSSVEIDAILERAKKSKGKHKARAKETP